MLQGDWSSDVSSSDLFVLTFQSPSHRGPRARRTHTTPVLGVQIQFQSPSHRGPRARLQITGLFTAGKTRFQSPSHRGPRARKDIKAPVSKSDAGFSPLLIGGRARGGKR